MDLFQASAKFRSRIIFLYEHTKEGSAAAAAFTAFIFLAVEATEARGKTINSSHTFMLIPWISYPHDKEKKCITILKTKLRYIKMS